MELWGILVLILSLPSWLLVLDWDRGREASEQVQDLDLAPSTKTPRSMTNKTMEDDQIQEIQVMSLALPSSLLVS